VYDPSLPVRQAFVVVSGERPLGPAMTDAVVVRPHRHHSAVGPPRPPRRTLRAMRITTKRGDDGTTGLFHGGRVRKDSELPTAYGAVDEAQAFLGLARAEAAQAGGGGAELDDLLTRLCRDLYVLMAELATLPENRARLDPGSTLVTEDMVSALEEVMDGLAAHFEPPTAFVVPGEDRVAALLDVARTVVRRAERHSLVAVAEASQVVPYLNRLSDLLWTMARWQESTSLLARDTRGVAER
jgi:cob(I)alamin adenosyltransferase